jgi:hypothetical protein
MCHRHQDRLRLRIVTITTKLCGNYDEQMWQCKNVCGTLRRKCVAIATKISAKTKTYDADVVCVMHLWNVAMKMCCNSDETFCQDKNLRCKCCMCDANPWQIATNFHGYCNGVQNKTLSFDELSSILRRVL